MNKYILSPLKFASFFLAIALICMGNAHAAGDEEQKTPEKDESAPFCSYKHDGQYNADDEIVVGAMRVFEHMARESFRFGEVAHVLTRFTALLDALSLLDTYLPEPRAPEKEICEYVKAYLVKTAGARKRLIEARMALLRFTHAELQRDPQLSPLVLLRHLRAQKWFGEQVDRDIEIVRAEAQAEKDSMKEDGVLITHQEWPHSDTARERFSEEGLFFSLDADRVDHLRCDECRVDFRGYQPWHHPELLHERAMHFPSTIIAALLMNNAPQHCINNWLNAWARTTQTDAFNGVVRRCFRLKGEQARESVRCLRYMLERDVNVNYDLENNGSPTLLTRAIFNNRPENIINDVALFLQHGAQANQKLVLERVISCVLTNKNNPVILFQVLQLLLENGADLGPMRGELESFSGHNAMRVLQLEARVANRSLRSRRLVVMAHLPIREIAGMVEQYLAPLPRHARLPLVSAREGFEPNYNAIMFESLLREGMELCYALDSGANINVANSRGETLAHLIATDQELALEGYNGGRPLPRAEDQMPSELDLRNMIAQGVDPLGTEKALGRLRWQADMLRILHKNRIDLLLRDQNGLTAYERATDPYIRQVLAELGGNPNDRRLSTSTITRMSTSTSTRSETQTLGWAQQIARLANLPSASRLLAFGTILANALSSASTSRQ